MRIKTSRGTVSAIQLYAYPDPQRWQLDQRAAVPPERMKVAPEKDYKLVRVSKHIIGVAEMYDDECNLLFTFRNSDINKLLSKLIDPKYKYTRVWAGALKSTRQRDYPVDALVRFEHHIVSFTAPCGARYLLDRGMLVKALKKIQTLSVSDRKAVRA